MDTISVLIEFLKAKQQITLLEKDILDTWNELNKHPIEMESAKKQVVSNDINYPDICFEIATMPTTVRVSRSYQPTEADIKYNLENQLIRLVKREYEEQRNDK